ncbi:hypothetical protein [Haloprofundus halobius]|nr:hypothetical protein [Haloprofundus halobius]
MTAWLWVGCLGFSGFSFLVAGALGALGLAFIGVDYVRGGVHMDLSVSA